MKSECLTSPVRPEPRPRARRSFLRLAWLAVVAAIAFAMFPAGVAGAAVPPVGLGTAGSFAVLAGSGITNTGPTTISGDVGTFPNPSESGFGTITLNGTDHAGDAVTQQAKTDLTTAYNVAAASGPPTSVATELGGTTLTPGVYHGTTLGLTGTLTLDTQGDPNAVFVFQTASTLITASNSSVIVLNGGTACNVFWQVSSSATLGTASHLIGTVLASASITATTGATIEGRLLAQNAAVTLDTNTITATTCAPPSSSAPPTTAPGTSTDGADASGGPDLSFLNSASPSGSGGITGGVARRSQVGAPTLPVTGGGLWLAIVGAVALGAGLTLVEVAKRRNPTVR